MTTPISLTTALITGHFDSLPDDTQFLLARTGLLPLFAAAGFHLAAAARLAHLLAWPLARTPLPARLRGPLLFAFELALLLWLAAIAGISAPLARALTYTVLRSGARLLEIDPDRRWLLVLSLLVAATLGRATPLGFALTVLALTGALFLEPKRARLLGPWLCTVPVVALGFGLVPLLGPLWFLTAGTLVNFLILPLAIFARLAASCGIYLPRLDGFLDHALARILALVGSGDALLGGAVWVRPAPFLLLAFAVFLAAFFWKRRRRLGLTLGGTLACAALALPFPRFAALDVGQGDALFIRTSHDILLEDAGPPGFRGRPAPGALALESFGIGPVHDVLLSHFDLDHRGGLGTLFARHRVEGALWFREIDLNDKAAEKVLASAELARVPLRFLTESSAPPGLTCALAPFPPGNDSCPLCLARLAGGGTALLTGDMSEKAEAWFLAHEARFPRAAILKVAHHGSRTSSTADFLAATQAREAWISVGARNRYGHPTEETLARLEKAGMKIRRTDQSGTLTDYGFALFSLFTLESMRPPESAVSRVYPGRPATAR
jgi:competence protein ComEC